MRPPVDSIVSFPADDGVILEGKMVLPGSPRGLLVFCHPHPLYQGTMENKVVHGLYKVFRDLDFAVLRFNFRGAGASQGVHGHGVTEQGDARGALAFLRSQVAGALPPTSPQVMGGYSFGSYVGLSVGTLDGEITHLIGVAPPLLGRFLYDFSMLRSDDPRPIYLVVGESDEFCPTTSFETLASALGQRCHARVIPGTDHFFAHTGHLLRRWMEDTARVVAMDSPALR